MMGIFEEYGGLIIWGGLLLIWLAVVLFWTHNENKENEENRRKELAKEYNKSREEYWERRLSGGH